MDKANRMAVLSFVAVLSIMAIGGNGKVPMANAATASISATNDVVGQGGSNQVTLCAGAMTLHPYQVHLINPSGVVVGQSLWLPAVPAGTCQTWNVPGDFVPPVSLSQVGAWSVEIRTHEAVQLFADFEVSFFVLPESPVGVAALTGSSMAALGAFLFFKRRNTVTETTA